MVPGWFNENLNRAYPFCRGTVGVDTPAAGVLSLSALPDAWIVDAGFTMGEDAGFVEGTHSVWLDRIDVAGDTICFTFCSDATPLQDSPLKFRFHLEDERFVTVTAGWNDGEDSSESETLLPQLWSGFVTSGDLSTVLDYTWDQAVVRLTGEATTEPALIFNLSGTLLRSLSLANNDRTRITAGEDCPASDWPYPVGEVFEAAVLLQGELRLFAGYNCAIVQDTGDNSLSIEAAVGSGEGEPCEEVLLFAEEQPPADSDLLSGGLSCRDTLRSVNGLGGPSLLLLAGNGVTIIPSPVEHKITIDVNRQNMTICGENLT